MKRTPSSNLTQWRPTTIPRRRSHQIAVPIIMTIVGLSATVGFAISSSLGVTQVDWTLEQSKPLTIVARETQTPLKPSVAVGEVGDSVKDIAGLSWSRASRHLLGFYQARCTACESAQPELVAFARANPTTAVWVITPKQHALVSAKFSNISSNLTVIPMNLLKAYVDYNVTGTPTHILVQNGKIRWRREGFAPGVLQSIP